MKYRKKPVVIDAMQYDTPQAADVILLWAGDAADRIDVHQDYLIIHTLEGAHRASLGDWIIRGVKGELYPCKPEIFAASHEPAESKPEGGVKIGDRVLVYGRHGAVRSVTSVDAVVWLDEPTPIGGGERSREISVPLKQIKPEGS